MNFFGKPLAYCYITIHFATLVRNFHYMSSLSASPWSQGKWRPRIKQERLEERLQTLDLVLKILVPAALLICLVLSIKFGSFNG